MQKKKTSKSFVKMVEQERKNPQKLISKIAKTRSSLRKALHVKKGKMIPKMLLASTAKKGGTLSKRARFAMAVQKVVKGKRKK